MTHGELDRLIEFGCWNYALYQANGEGFRRINALCR
jgi:hypothetical protein